MLCMTRSCRPTQYRMDDQKESCEGFEYDKLSTTEDCSLRIQGTMTYTPMKSWTHVEVQPGAVVYTSVAEMNVQPFGGAKFFVTFLDRVSVYVKGFHIKRKREATELLKQRIWWLECQTETPVKKVLLDADKEYWKRWKEQESLGLSFWSQPAIPHMKTAKLTKWIAS